MLPNKVQAYVYVKDGKPRKNTVKLEQYMNEEWSGFPQYHVRNTSTDIWVTQHGTKNCQSNCSSVAEKMILNWAGVAKDKTVDELSDERGEDYIIVGGSEKSYTNMLTMKYGIPFLTVYGEEELKNI